MSNYPNPNEPLPPGYAHYPRGQAQDVGNLSILADGYFGLSRAFFINIGLVIAANLAGQAIGLSAPDALVPIAILSTVGLGVVVFSLTLPANRKIGAGLGWRPSSPVVASLLMALNSLFCCGIVGYLVVQEMAMRKIRTYGLTPGFFGLKKADVERRIAELQSPGVA